MKKNLLTDFSFFSDIEPETLEMIAQKGDVLEFESENIVFQIEDVSEHIYGLLEGEVDLSLVFKDKVLKTEIEYEEAIQASIVDEERSIVVDTVYQGQVFGWSSLVGSGRRTVTAQCTKPSRVIAFAAADLETMFEEDYSLGYTIMKKLGDIISKRLKNRTNKLIETWVEAFDAEKI